MTMTLVQAVITIAVCALATMLTRFLPFWVFPAGKPLPKVVAYLSQVLPYAVIGLLVVYCLKDVNVMSAPHGLPEAIAVAAIVAVHAWKRNVLISIATGTALYMVLVQVVFG